MRRMCLAITGETCKVFERPMQMWRIASFIFVLHAMVSAERNFHGNRESSMQQLDSVTDAIIMPNDTCDSWTAWVPPRIHPAIILQAVNVDYADMERNFIAVMEANSNFSRENLYLLCLDPQTVEIFKALQIHCVVVNGTGIVGRTGIWGLRVDVVRCLLQKGFDVILSDADALWVHNPMKDLASVAHNESSIVASRGKFPYSLRREWGTTMCMGFVLFRASGNGMKLWQDVMRRVARKSGDDQIALNRAAEELGIVWDMNSDMRYEASTQEGRGVVAGLSTASGIVFTVTLLPTQNLHAELLVDALFERDSSQTLQLTEARKRTDVVDACK